MPRHTFAVDRRIVSCIDCEQPTIGNHNTKRCRACNILWHCQQQIERRRLHRKNNLPPARQGKQTPLPQRNVTDKQIIAYLRAYAPKSYFDIIRRIKALQQPHQLLEKELVT